MLAFAAPAGAAPTQVSITFDDVDASQLQAQSMLAAHGMKATFYVPSNKVGSDPYYMNWSQVQGLADDGHEIGGHSLDHLDLTTLSLPNLQTQICGDHQNLINHGFDPVSFAYPYAKHNAQVRATVQSCGYQSGRGVGNVGCSGCSPAESIPPVDPYALQTPVAWTSSTAVSSMQGYVTNALQNGGGWLVLTFHNICNGCNDNGITAAQLDELLTWLQGQQANGVQIKTVREVMQSPPPPEGPNLLQNPGLENPPPNTAPSCWERQSFAGSSGGGNIGSWSSTSDSHSGSSAEQVQISSYNDGDQKLVSVQDLVARNPIGVAATPSSSGGSLGSQTFYYTVTATTALGETQASSEVNATTTGPNASVFLSWTASPGATGYRIYRSTTSGTETLLASVGTNAFFDSGSATPGTATPPASNTAVRSTPVCSPAGVPGHVYRVSAWYKTSPGVTARMIAYYRNAAGTWIFWRSQPIPAAADWHKVSWLTPSLPAGATALGVAFSLLSTGTATVDDLKLSDADAKIDQTISFTAPTGVRYGDPDSDLGATASSGLAVTYTSQTPGVCTIVAGKLHVVSAGECTIDADQAGDLYYNAAPQVQRTFTIGQADQTISFTAPSGVRFGDADSDLGATASSGLAVTYTTQTPSVCTIVAGQLHVVSAGECTIDADQAGNDNYNAAPQVERTFTIGKADQTISFTAPSGVDVGDPDSDLGATASSGLAVTYTSQTTGVCTIVAGQLHVVSAGECTIDADQAGNDNYNAAPQVERTFTIAKADQTISFTAPTGVRYGDPDSDLGATSSSGLTVTYTSQTPSVCTIVAGQLHVVTSGDCTIDADQAGDDNYNAAPQVQRTFTIGKADQTISFAAPTGVRYGDPDSDLGATASSGLTVTYTTQTPSVCTIVGGQLHVVSAGECTIDADQAGNDNYNAAPQVERTFTIGKADQTIDFSAPSGVRYGDPDSDLGATASSGLTVTYTTQTPTVCTIVAGQLHVVSAGECTIDADQAGNDNYNAVPQVEQTFTIGKADQTITFTAPSGVDVGDPDSDLGATASSGLAVAYTSQTPTVCTIFAGQLHVVAAGDCTIDADQAGNDNYNAAPQVERTFTIGKADQTITFTAPSGVRYGDADSDLGATASSGLAVTYTTQTPTVCTIVAGQLHVVSAGECTIDADQAGNDNYNAAPQVEQTFTIGKADQTITFTAPSDVRYGDPDSDLGATSSSGLTVTYTSQTPSVCTIVAGQLHVVTPGDCTIDADQAGDDNYNAAPQVERTFAIGKADQTITFTAPTGVRYGDPDSDLGATASSGLAVTYTSQTPSVCTIVAGQLHVVALGDCTIDADQAGNDNYNAAPQVQRTFTIGKADQTITFTAPTGVRYGDPDSDLGATASSGLAVTYTSQTPSVCTIVAGQLHVVVPGDCTIDADQAGDDNYNAAPQVQRTFTIGKADQTISFTAPTGVRYGDPDLDLGATASSGLAVIYTSQTPSVCTIVAGQLHTVQFGTCTIDADQAGDDNYNPAPQVERTFPIAGPGYPRPKAGTPTSIPFVIAYDECLAPNRTHGPSLAFDSCNPPQQSSAELTAGTPDANGQAANSIGRLTYGVLSGDIRVAFSLADVRKKSDLSDYTGELNVVQALRLTDHLNPSNEIGTVQDNDFSYAVPCTATASAGIGATCDLTTTANSLVPGILSFGNRAIWELGQIQVFDGGPDELAGTAPNTVFARQGIFVP